MTNFLIFFSILLIPIILLFFIRKSKQKVIHYPIFLIEDIHKNKIALKLLQFFRKNVDLIFDIIIAFLITLYITTLFFNPTKNKTAFCIDGSFSMIHNDINYNNSLALALERYNSIKKNYKKHDIYIHSFNKKQNKSQVINISRLKDKISQIDFTTTLKNKYDFYTVDYNDIQSLLDKGYKKIIYLTDNNNLKFNNNKIDIQYVNVNERKYSYPIYTYYNIVKNNYEIVIFNNKSQTLNFSIKEVIGDEKNNISTIETEYRKEKINNYFTKIIVNKSKLYSININGYKYFINCKPNNYLIKGYGPIGKAFEKIYKNSLNIDYFAVLDFNKNTVLKRSDVLQYMDYFKFNKTIKNKIIISIINDIFYNPQNKSKDFIFPLNLTFGKPIVNRINKFLLQDYEKRNIHNILSIDKTIFEQEDFPILIYNIGSNLIKEENGNKIKKDNSFDYIGYYQTSMLYSRNNKLIGTNIPISEFVNIDKEEVFSLKKTNKNIFLLILLISLLYFAKILYNLNSE